MNMMKTKVLAVLAFSACAFGAFAAKTSLRPIALVGDLVETEAIESEVARPDRIACEKFAWKELSPSEYSKYAAVCLFAPSPAPKSAEAAAWATPDDRRMVAEYLAAGGRIVLGGGVPSSLLVPKKSSEESARSAFLSQKGIARIRKSYGRFLDDCRRRKLPLTEPDDVGFPRPTAEGRQAEAMRKEYASFFASVPDVLRSADDKLIFPVPLGGHGTLETAKKYRVAPKLGPMKRPTGEGLLLFGDGVRAAVVVRDSSDGTAQLARECARHLSEMTGEKVEIVDALPKTGPAILLGEDPSRTEKEVAIVRREGDRVLVTGRGLGVGVALTYFLESLGCRYLWPGKSGKIIPKTQRVVFPAVSLDFVPTLPYRRIRHSKMKGEEPPNDRVRLAFRRLKFDYRSYRDAFNASDCDEPGERGYFAWHGVCADDHRTVRWTHYFGDYVKRYQKQHPDWFALQPDGTRKVRNPKRPCLCLSNDELARETAKNILANFRADPQLEAHELSLADGGGGFACVCENCRRLDPTNAPLNAIMSYRDANGRLFPYVSMSDRVMHFMNRVAELVTAEMPGKKMTVYAYSYYRDPPVHVKPHPALLILLVSCNYGEAEIRDTRLERDFAGWSCFGNKLMWRPNALRGMSLMSPVPQNFARYIFRDISQVKANGAIGVDISCYEHSWGMFGLDYYMATKAILNPDNLDYETLLADFLEKGFGPAAPAMGRYFADLEKMLDESARRELDDDDLNTSRLARMRQYLEIFDPDRLDACLDEATRAASGDEAVLRRIRMFRLGDEYGRHVKRISAAQAADAPNLLELQRQFLEFMQRHVGDPDDLMAVSPSFVGFYDWPLRELFSAEASKGE